MDLRIIARIKNDFNTKFGIPRQSMMAGELISEIVFEPDFRDENALRGIEDYSHIWLIWGFTEANKKRKSLMVKPPKLGGNTRVGVFATRSPFRPNPIGLSSVKLDRIEKTEDNGPVLLIVSGADLMDGTPIYDIKPYLSFTDSHPDAKNGFAENSLSRTLDISFPDELLLMIPPDKRAALISCLELDPRPGYHDDGELYGISYADFDIRFEVNGGTLYVRDVVKKGQTHVK